jgi:uncharacterized protein (DUF488 family)
MVITLPNQEKEHDSAQKRVDGADLLSVYTIGFAGKSAEQFFETLKRHRIARLLDIRLHNKSQLAGFTKQKDLQYFLKVICSADYVHLPELAPTEELLKAYQKRAIDWYQYEREFLNLMKARQVEKSLSPETFSEPTVLLCSEPTADRCHRRLVAEYLREKWGNGMRILHL